jgi:hypothetical protein
MDNLISRVQNLPAVLEGVVLAADLEPLIAALA